MDDKQLLDAIRGIVQEETGKIVDEKITANNDVLLQKMDEKITANNDVLLQKMDEKITANNDVLLQKMDEKITASNDVLLRQTGVLMDEKIAASNEVLLRGVNVIVENKYDEILKLLREDYGPVAAAARDTARKVADYDALKNKVRDHDRALQSHRKELDALKKRAI